MTLDALETHRGTCQRCTPVSNCSIAAAILQSFADRLACRIIPDRPIEVLDLRKHVAECTRCNSQRLCVVGRKIVDDGTTALIDTGARGRMGQA